MNSVVTEGNLNIGMPGICSTYTFAWTFIDHESRSAYKFKVSWSRLLELCNYIVIII